MASRAGGLAKAPRVVPPPSGLLLWGLWLALCSPSAPEPPAVAVPSLWVTWGHLWLQGAMSSCLLPLQGQPPGVIWVQHKDSGSSQGTMTSLGGYRFCMGSVSLCRGTVTVTRALQPLSHQSVPTLLFLKSFPLLLAAPGEAAASWHWDGVGEPLVGHELCPHPSGNVPGTGLSCLCPAWLPRPCAPSREPSKGRWNCLPAVGRWERSHRPTNTGRRLRQRFPKQLSAGIRERLCLDRLQLWVAAG